MDLTDSYKRVFPAKILKRYDFLETRDAAGVVSNTNPVEFKELAAILSGFKLMKTDIEKPGGNEGPVAKRLNAAFRDRGWREGSYDLRIVSTLKLKPYRSAGETKPTIIQTEVLNEGYKADNVKGKVALDVEWNAKDGNLDRDVAYYRSLYDAGIITAGVMITRTHQDLKDLATQLDRDPNPFRTTTTTNLPKLRTRLSRGDGGGCPILAVAVTSRCFEVGTLNVRCPPFT